MKLTALAVKEARPCAGQRKLFDGEGMYLLVTPAGQKYWRLKYRYRGKEKMLALGVYPEVTLAQARKRKAESRKLIEQGLDPSQERKRERRAVEAAAKSSFEAAAREWHSKMKRGWVPSHAKAVMKTLERDVFPHIGRMPIADITTADLIDILHRVEKRGALDVATRIQQRCRAVFTYAAQHGLIKSNPAQDLKGIIKKPRVEHRAFVDEKDLPELLRKIDSYSGSVMTRYGLEFALLTFVRVSELRGARWEEFDLEAGLWRIPGERMKMNRDHLVPLASQTLGLLERIREVSWSRELVFPGDRSPSKPMSENTLLYALYGLGYHGRATVHGFRATASTILNEARFRSVVIERQLGHVERNQVKAAYDRAAYLEERRKMMQWWANYLDTARGESEVIPIGSARARQ